MMSALLFILTIFPFVGWLILKVFIMCGLHDPQLGYFAYMLVGFVVTMLVSGINIKFRK